MASKDGLEDNFVHLEGQYKRYRTKVDKLGRELLSEDLVSEEAEADGKGHRLSDFQEDRMTDYLNDELSLFRALRRSRYDVERAREMVLDTVKWRLDSQVDHLDIRREGTTLQYLERGLFHYIWPSGKDKSFVSAGNYAKDALGRPVALLRLAEVLRDGDLEPLRQFIVAMLEIGRRYLRDLARDAGVDLAPSVIQFVLLVDLKGAGIANMEMEIVPFLMDLLKNHFPGLCAAIFVLNYGWMYSGMWAIAKRMVPEKAISRIFFPSLSEISTFIEPASLPKEYGGENDYEFSWKSDPIMKRYGKPSSQSWTGSGLRSPALSRKTSRAPTRANSFESLADHFSSAAQTTPWSSRPGTSDGTGTTRRGPGQLALGMTPTASVSADLNREANRAQDRPVREKIHEDGKSSPYSPSALLDALRTRLQGKTAINGQPPQSPEGNEADDESDDGGRARIPRFRRRSSFEFSKRRLTRPKSLSPTRSMVFDGEEAPLPNRYIRYRKPPAAQGGSRGLPYPRRRARDLIKMLTHLTILRFLALHRSIRGYLSMVVKRVAGPQAALSTAWIYLSFLIVTIFGGRAMIILMARALRAPLGAMQDRRKALT